MRRTKLLAPALVLCLSTSVSCAPASEAPSVAFGASAPIGRWQATNSDEQSDAAVASRGDAPSGSVATVQANSAGRSAPPASNEADGGAAQPTGSSLSSTAANGGGAGGPADVLASDVKSLSFEVTTSAAGGRYQPKNIGAIWIEDDNGDVVKTLQVWAGTRRRYLTGYLGAMAGSSIDVTASATLPRHQTHMVLWNLKDRSGSAVVPGTYHLRMELTDGNQTGRSNTVVFDSSQGPKTLSPPDAPSFGAMKLDLQ